MTVFFEVLRRSWRQIIYWGLGLIIWAFYPFFMIPNTEDGLQQYVDLLDELDPAMLSAVGIADAASLGTPEGFVGYAFFGYILLVMSVFAVIAGLNVSAVEEESGTMDLVLSLPIPRWQVIAEKLAAYIVMIVGISLLGFIGLLTGNALAPVEVDVSFGRYLEGAFNIIPGSVLILTFTTFVGTLVRRRATAAAIAGGFVVASFLLDAVAKAANSDAADAVSQLSVFAHYNGTQVLVNGLAWGSVIALFIVAALLSTGAVTLFQRRDIAI